MNSTQQYWYMRFLLLVCVWILALIFGLYIGNKNSRINCQDFIYQETAQKAFYKNPIKYAKLDGDKDGLTCEHLPSKK